MASDSWSTQHLDGMNLSKLPSADLAVIDDTKVRDYLWNPLHPVGRFKARYFTALGYSPSTWERLRNDLLLLAKSGLAVPGQPSGYGLKYEVRGTSKGQWVVQPASRAFGSWSMVILSHGS